MSRYCPAGHCPSAPRSAGPPLCMPGIRGAGTAEDTHPARVALQKLDFLKELDVVGAQAVQLTLQGLDGVLGHAAFLWGAGQVGRPARRAGGGWWEGSSHRHRCRSAAWSSLFAWAISLIYQDPVLSF